VASFYRANLELVQPQPRFQLHDARWPILTRDEERPAALVSGTADIEDSLIANGCRIEGRVRRSILFPGVVVAGDAEVTDAVIMPDTRIEAGARVDRAIIDKYVRVGEGAVDGDGTNAGPPELAWLAGLVLVGKDAWIPPGGRVERPASIGVGGRYEDFQQGRIASGTMIPNRLWFEEIR